MNAEEDYYREVMVAELEEAAKQKGDLDFSKIGDLVASGLIYELFGRYTAPSIEAEEVKEDELMLAWAETDTAICVINLASGGVECDRRVEDDYYLLDSEKQMLETVYPHFRKVIVVLNLNGVVDTAWICNYSSIKAVLFMGTPGEQGVVVLADIPVGDVNPSGRLCATFGLSYEDYPTAKHFSFNKDEPDSILEYKYYGLDAEENRDKQAMKSPGLEPETIFA